MGKNVTVSSFRIRLMHERYCMELIPMVQNLNIVPPRFLFNGNELTNESQPLSEAMILAGIANMYSESSNRLHASRATMAVAAMVYVSTRASPK